MSKAHATSKMNSLCNSRIYFLFITDEDNLFGGKEPDIFWEDFAPVATDLWERLQMCLSNGNSPCESSDEYV